MISPASSIVVTLRGLTPEGAGIGQNGIVLESTGTGTLSAGVGIAITPSNPNFGSASAHVLIANC